MPNISNFLQKSLLDTLSGKSTLALQDVYVGLLITPGGKYYAGKEPKDTAYARQRITFSDPIGVADDPSYMMITNATDITWPAAESSWGTIKHFGLFSSDDATADLLFFGTLQDQVKINRWDAVTIPAGGLSVRLG